MKNTEAFFAMRTDLRGIHANVSMQTKHLQASQHHLLRAQRMYNSAMREAGLCGTCLREYRKCKCKPNKPTTIGNKVA